MRIAIIADCYPPIRSSASIMLENLAYEFFRQGHQPIVITPDSTIKQPITKSVINGVEVFRVLAPKTKDVSYIRRTLSEFLMPFIIRRRLSKSDDFQYPLDGIIWYSPSIFFGPLIKYLKKNHNCKGYLILRDIFPEWAVDMGIMKRGIPFYFFKIIESYQYSVADTIGFQAQASIDYLSKWEIKDIRKIELLNNWLSDVEPSKCPIILKNTILNGRKIFVYSGNMGIAQGIKLFIDAIHKLDQTRDDIGFVFVGRGSEVKSLIKESKKRELKNILFFDEIHHNEISNLYSQCHFGLVLLDPRHRTHNVPGKFISYMHNSLPVLACINEGNDLLEIINNRKVGFACYGMDCNKVVSEILKMIDNPDYSYEIPNNCKTLAIEMYSSRMAVQKIINTFA